MPNGDDPTTSSAAPVEESGSLIRRVLVNTGALSGSSLWRIGISFLLQLIIARVLGVQALGVYTVALAYLNVGQVVGELGLPTLLTRDLAANPQQRRAYYSIALCIQLVASVLVWLGITALAYALPYDAIMRTALILIGASLPFYAVTSASETLFRAAERMELVLAVEASINLLIIVISIILLVVNPAVLPLIGVLVVTQLLSAALCLIIVVRTRLLTGAQEQINISLRELWRNTRTFFAVAIAEVLQQRLDILLLSVFAGPVVTGIYSAAYNLVRVAVKLVQSYWQALYPTLSRLYAEKKPRYTQLSESSFRYGLMLILLAASLISVAAPELIRIIFTAQYDASAQVLRWLIWLAPLLFIESFAVIQFMVQNRQRLGLGVILLNLLILVALLPLLARQFGAVGASWASLAAVIGGALTGLALLRRRDYDVNLVQTALLWMIALAASLLVMAIPIHWLLKMAVAAAIIAAGDLVIGAAPIHELRRLQSALHR